MRTPIAKLAAAGLLAGTLLATTGVDGAGAGHGAEGQVCLVADPGGFDDGGFNANALAGLERAGRRLHVETQAAAADDFAGLTDVIEGFVDSGECDLIIGVGFLVAGAMEPFAAANPAQRFTTIDSTYFGAYANVSEVLFRVDQSAFLAGYVAAGVSETGAVGVYGGAPIPPVTQFMDGYALGVAYYSYVYGTTVDVLGWDPDTQTGLVLNFEFANPALGKSTALDLFDLGADTVFPVAGATGFGSLEAAAELKAAGDDVRIVGVDTDWYDTVGDAERVILTSVLKNTGAAVYNTTAELVNGTWTGGTVWEDLASGGTDIAPFHKTNNKVPGHLKNDLKDIRTGIIDGTIPTLP